MTDKAVDVLKQEEETLGTPLSKLLEPDTPPKEAISKATVDLQESLKGFIEAKVQKIMETQPQTVKVVGQPQVTVKFPEIQKTEGNVSVKGPVESHIKNWPSFGDIFKSAFSAIRFPDLQKITGDVTAKILNFPDVFKVSGKVDATVKFPEVQKVEGKSEVTNLPTAEGEEAGRQANPTKYVPVRLTNGRSFYDVMSQTVQSTAKAIQSIATPAGENHIGEFGGRQTSITNTPTLTVASSYAANDYVGTSASPIVFPVARIPNGSGIILSAVLIDYALQSIPAELWLFDATVTPPNDSAAWTISDADSLKLIGVISFAAYYASAANSVSPVNNVGLAFKTIGSDINIYGCLVTRGAPAYSNGDVSIRLNVLQN